MTMDNILAQLDAEIAQLQRAKALLTGSGSAVTARKPGRPKAVHVAVKPAKTASKRKPLNAEARKRIADAQRKRWAASKKAAKAPVRQGVVRGPKPLAKKTVPTKPATEAAPF